MNRTWMAALVGLVAPAALANQGGRWEPRASLISARQEVGAARIGGSVYVVGGLLAAPRTVTDTCEVYDIANDTWSPIASMPAPRDHMGVAAVAGRLYVMGGYQGDFVARADAWVYDPNTNVWTPIRPLPAARGACWAAATGGRIYLFGGTDASGADSHTTFVYDPSTDQWTTGRDMPTARNHLVAVELGGLIYVMGGRPPITNVNERYDPARDEWRTMAPMPTARSAMACAALGGQIVVAGGEGPVLHAETEIYDVATNSWTCAQPMAIPRHAVGAAALDDRMLAAGGGIVQGYGPTAAVDSFVPPPELPPVRFALKQNGSPVGTLLVERFAGRLFATVTITATARTPCENAPVTGAGPGQATFSCRGTTVTVRRVGATLTWQAGAFGGTLCRM